MPEQYFHNQHLFDQTRYLMHRRGFYVTNTAILE